MDGLLRNPVAAPDSDGGQVPAVHHAVNGHLRDAHHGGDLCDPNVQSKLTKTVAIRLQGLNLFNEVKFGSMPVPGSTRNFQYFAQPFFISIRAML